MARDSYETCPLSDYISPIERHLLKQKVCIYFQSLHASFFQNFLADLQTLLVLDKHDPESNSVGVWQNKPYHPAMKYKMLGKFTSSQVEFMNS